MEQQTRRGRVIVTVVNDISTDQRVRRVCALLHEEGFEVLLVGRRLPESPPLPERPYRMHRFRMPVNKGPVFYALFNLRLFLFLLFRRAALLYANDLDTLAPAALVSACRGIPMIYDSHELFTEVPELVGRPRVQNIWKWIEKRFIHVPRGFVTVNRSIAAELHSRYGRLPDVVRNIPERIEIQEKPTREELGLPTNRRVLILQGSGINVDRGAEELVRAMASLPGCTLVIAGSGDVIDTLKGMCAESGLGDRIIFLPRQSYENLMRYTMTADLGLSLDKDTNLNYRYSLPNKLFDYIHAGIPVLVSDLPEVVGIVREHGVGWVLTSHEPGVIARSVTDIFNDGEVYMECRRNTAEAARVLTWENEKDVLRDVIARAMIPAVQERREG